MRIGAGKVLRNLGRVAFEYQHSAVYWIRQRTGQNQFAAFACLPRQVKVRIAKLRAPDRVILANFVEQKVMHMSAGFLS
jgi:hypothetical protein